MFEVIKGRGKILKKPAAQLDGDRRRAEREHRQQRERQRGCRARGADIPGEPLLARRLTGPKNDFSRPLR